MKLNWAERLVVNNAPRVLEQRMQVRWMKKAAPLAQGSRILEIGCGRGAGACVIAKEFQPSSLHAMDLDFIMIRKAMSYIPPDRRNGVSLYVGDAEHLPYRDGAFDAVFGFGFLHHVINWRAALAEVGRVLKPGGVYFIEEFYPTLYQNFITKRILVHPTKDRFLSKDLKEALNLTGLPLKDCLEIERIGILGVCIKQGV
jgi:ubiquinone/menaquinone biosynthesis C-methylase UbiE